MDGFAAFWTAYPRKVGKAACVKIWARIKPSLELRAKMLATIEQAKRSEQWTKDGGQYIPHPSTWLNQGRWDDVIGAPVVMPTAAKLCDEAAKVKVDCALCGGSGMVSVPHLRCVVNGEWVSTKIARGSNGTRYKMAVCCSCAFGVWTAGRSQAPTLSQYERKNPCWRQQMSKEEAIPF